MQEPALTLVTRDRPGVGWNEFVRARASASIYLLSEWTLLAREVFGHDAFFIEARDAGGNLAGVLPMVRQKSLLFGNFATSVPFFNYGGALADSPDLARRLMEHAREHAERLGCNYVEFRDAQPREGEWQVRLDKVTMILDLPADFAALSKQLGAKLRSQVKRADRESPTTRVGGRDLLDGFYEVFCENMRQLGTPVYPRRFFEAILTRFPDEAAILVVERAGKPAAAAFLIFANGRAEIPWAACRSDAKPLGFNMKLYWEVLGVAITRGCTAFDFGRSTADSGTFQFKKQWGAKPVQLHWHRWERGRTAAEASGPLSESRAMRLAVSVWQRLPLSLTNTIGPWVSPHLPW